MTNDYSNNTHVEPNDELSELRSLLFGIEPAKLNKLYERLDNPEIKAEDISRLLPEAVILRTMQDKQLGEAIVPTVEHAIQSSVKQDLNILSTAIFPIMGPAIRKAITTALQEMIQSLDASLEQGFSPQSLKWRLEARQTGKTFAEVVLLRTLIYRVEQVFLIHKKTGLMLQHRVAPKVNAQDPDLVSAMLTAIQDFVKDSFNTQKNDGLQSLHFGELTIWIEEGPQAVLAGIIRGTAPQELRLVFQEAIEKIHLKLNRELIFFQGETEFFPGEDKKFKNLVLQIQKLLDAAKYVDKNVGIQIVGHTDLTGTETRNIALSQARANKILSYLSSQGINTSNFTTIGVADSQPLRSGLVEDNKLSRRVSFKILLSDQAK